MNVKILFIVLLSIGGSTVAGVLAGLIFRRIPHRLNDIVLGFAAGVMLAASVLGLIAPAFETGAGNIFPALFGAFTGALGAASAGISAAVIFSYIMALVFRSRTKKN